LILTSKAEAELAKADRRRRNVDRLKAEILRNSLKPEPKPGPRKVKRNLLALDLAAALLEASLRERLAQHRAHIRAALGRKRARV
jgi:hypothetical protein